MTNQLLMTTLSTIEMIGDRVRLDYSVEQVAKGLEAATGIHLPDGARKKLEPPFVEATVLAAGPKCTQVKTGDVVLVNTVSIITTKTEPHVSFTEENRIIGIVRTPKPIVAS